MGVCWNVLFMILLGPNFIISLFAPNFTAEGLICRSDTPVLYSVLICSICFDTKAKMVAT